MRFGSAFVAVILLLVSRPAGAIRPTDGDGWFGNGYDVGVPVVSIDSASGNFRVFFVESSLDAVQVGDLDMNGVPDFAEGVALHADEVWADTVDLRGFRPPLDDSIYHDTPDFGGDGRYDIYLMNMTDSDGYRVIEACTGIPFHCAGYFAMENDFAGFGYPSDDIAIRILTSHEFFHAVQDAYDADQDRKWTEGTAVWNTEQIYPEAGELAAFVPFFLDRPERPFDRTGGGIADLYPYGAGIWAQFLTERFDPDIVRMIWEACEDLDGSDPDFMEATDAVLQAQFSSTFLDAFEEFTHWNLFTAERADPTRAYADGADWPSVRLEPQVSGFPISTVLRSEGMSARYLPMHLPDLGGDLTTLTVSVESRPVRAAVFFWDGTTLSGPLGLTGPDPNRISLNVFWEGGDASLFLVITGTIKGALPHDVTVTLEQAILPPDAGVDADPGADGDGGSCGCRAARHGGSGWGVAVVVALAALVIRRRRGAWLASRTSRCSRGT